MIRSKAYNGLFYFYIALVFVFVFLPILTSFVFSFNSERFPTIPLGNFTLNWYSLAFTDADVWDAFRVSLIVSLSVAFIATFLGFCTAYTCLLYTSPSPRDS